MPARAVVVATEAPEADKLLGLPHPGRSVAETCLYFSCDQADWHPSFLMLNGECRGPINNIAFPSRVSSEYAPAGKSLACMVVLGNLDGGDVALIDRVRAQLVDWSGLQVGNWDHLQTYGITHALPDQLPPLKKPNLPGPPGPAGDLCLRGTRQPAGHSVGAGLRAAGG